MPYFNPKFSDTDNKLASFAKAFAQPETAAIIHAILFHDNEVTMENLCYLTPDVKVSSMHLMELKHIGIIKMQCIEGLVKCHVDKQLLKQMTQEFAVFFEKMRTLEPVV